MDLVDVAIAVDTADVDAGSSTASFSLTMIRDFLLDRLFARHEGHVLERDHLHLNDVASSVL